ncbi:MAG: CNNM domain-containing protein, partial [Acidimicrobiia bacterium]|nr:CNNM domain-containing protein [Acidimicrobiia bacterium]
MAANAYFVAAEFGMIAIDPALVAQRAEEGDRSARRLQQLLGRLTFHLSGAQLGITVMSLLLGSVAEPTVARLIEPTVERVVGAT